MKIILGITGLAMGGAENQVVSVAENLSQRGHKVTIAYILEPALVVPQVGNVDVVWLGGDKTLLGMAKAFRNYLKLIKKLQPDVVHSHMFHVNILARVARLFVRTPRVVSTAHSNNEGGRVRMLAYRLTHRLADVFTNVSAEAVTAFEQKKAAPKNTMLATHNGINTTKFSFNPAARLNLRQQLSLNENKVFVAVGRFHAAKDYPNLFNAFVKVLQQQPNCKLLVVGDGELRPELERLLAQLGIEDKVNLLGVRKDVPELLSASDVFVLSSAWEGFPLVVGEALSTERLVVTTDAGGAREFLVNNDFLVPISNNELLANAMLEAAKLNEQEAEAIGKQGRQRIIEKYSLDAVVDRWEDIYTVG